MVTTIEHSRNKGETPRDGMEADTVGPVPVPAPVPVDVGVVGNDPSVVGVVSMPGERAGVSVVGIVLPAFLLFISSC